MTKGSTLEVHSPSTSIRISQRVYGGSSCACIHIHAYAYIYVYIYMLMYMCIYISIDLYNIYIYVYIYIDKQYQMMPYTDTVHDRVDLQSYDVMNQPMWHHVAP